MSGISALQIAKDALLSHQAAISTTGTNIANANTPGYTRQKPIFSTLGQSVKILKIERIYDQFLGAQINERMHSLGCSEAKQDGLGRIEMIFDEVGDGGISELLNKFWNAWEDVSANPSGQTERLALVSTSQSLTSKFRAYGDGILSLQHDANSRIGNMVQQVNRDISDIADINGRIAMTPKDDSSMNDLRDKRAELLSGLAEIVDFHYLEDSSGSINIYLSDGMFLVEGVQTGELDAVVIPENPENHPYAFYDVVFKDDAGEGVINDVLTGGQLKGYLDVRDTEAEGYMESLDDVAAALVYWVNEKHEQGYDMNQNLGEKFFDPSKTAARNMEVSAAIVADINKIAASATVNSDGGNAGVIGALRDELLMNEENATINGYFDSVVWRIGQDAADANRAFDHHTNLLTQMTNKREAISGVSIDEEMINLIKYQNGYNAAARLCSVASQLADTLINLGV